MTTFGHTLDNGDSALQIQGELVAYAHTCPSNGTATSMTAKLRCTVADKSVALALYKKSDLSLVAYTEEKTVLADGFTWVTFDINWGGTLIGGTEYYLAIWADTTGGGSARISMKTVSPANYFKRVIAYNYPTFPNPGGLADSTRTYDFLVYVTYGTDTEEVSPPSSGTQVLWPKETYASGYLPRYQKRNIVGYYHASGDLRTIEVNASGHLLTDVDVSLSGLDIQVNISGDPVIISGQPVIISGQPVTISGDHVYVESGARVVTTAASGQGASGAHVYLESGPYSTVAHLYGYHHASGIWVPLAVTLSGCLGTVYCQSGGLF